MIHGHGDDTYRYPDIRINFSSNIYGHADLSELKAHLQLRLDLISTYPEPDAHSLEAVIAAHHHIPTACVLATNGATDAIYLIAQTFCHTLQSFTVDNPTFSEYADACTCFDIPCSNAPLSSSAPNSICWLCNPNNPDGRTYSPTEILQRSQEHALLVVDQSYEDYTLADMLSPQDSVGSTNILQLHSLTKTYAVPGLRIGYVVGPAHLIDQLRHSARPWAVNALAIEAGKWLIQHHATAIADLPAYLAETQRLRQAINQLPNFHALPTATNFMLVKMAQGTAAQLKDFLATHHNILIRDASNFPTLTPQHFRIATQLPHENDLLVEAMKKLMI